MSAIIMKFKAGKPVETSVEGIPGTVCRDITKPYEEAAAGKVISTKDTAEASLPPTQATITNEAQIGG